MDFKPQFTDAIRAAGLNPPDYIQADSKLHRFPTNGKPRDLSGWYVLHSDGIPAGAFGDWRSGLSETWRADIGRKLTAGEEAAFREAVEAMRREREAEEKRGHEEAAFNAITVWNKSKPAPQDHPYLQRKNVKPHGVRVCHSALVIPLEDSAGKLHSLQSIAANGEKKFLPGGRVTGCYFVIGNPAGTPLCIAEGFATGASVHEATGYPVAVAFNAGNLEPVAKALRGKFPDLELILCADDDVSTDGNPGFTKAKAAAAAVGAKLAKPDFGTERPDGVTDFNDLMRLRGVDAVKSQIEKSRESGQQKPKADSGNVWSKAKDAPTLLAEEDKEIEGLAKDLIIPGTITLMAAPRGLGKTLVAHGASVTIARGGNFRGESVTSMRVLLVDRDNPKHVVKSRLRGFGAGNAGKLKVLTREDAPDLRDKSAWESFPVTDYDVIVIDSLGSFTEGVTEKEGKETTQILATVLDLIHRGPAVLLLANCTKDALSVKGRGEWMDRVDIVYEVRDATAFTPSGKKDWWMELPEAGESAWGDRAARRKNRTDYRLAFVPSKFRLGAQPDPFCLELRLPADEPWTLDDVTGDLIQAGENVIKESAAKKEQKEKAAVDALAEVVGARHAVEKTILKTEAQDYLHDEMEISRDRARELVKANIGVLWRLEQRSGKGNPTALIPIGSTNPRGNDPYEGKSAADQVQSGPQKYDPCKSSSVNGFSDTLFSRREGGNYTETNDESEDLCKK